MLEFIAEADERYRTWLVHKFAAFAHWEGLEIFPCRPDGRPVHFDDAAIRSLSEMPQLVHLRRFELRGIDTTALQTLAESAYLTGFTSHHLNCNRGIEPGAVRAILGSCSLCNVTELDLGGRCVTVAQETDELIDPWSMTYEVSHSSHIYPNVGIVGVQALAESPGATRLRILDLSYNDIGDSGAKALLGSPYIANLERLTLKDDTIGVEARETLRARFG